MAISEEKLKRIKENVNKTKTEFYAAKQIDLSTCVNQEYNEFSDPFD